MISRKITQKIVSLITVLFLVVGPIFASANEIIITDPTPDTKPPQLNSLSISSNEATLESTVKLVADVSDDLSGIQTVYGYYNSPNHDSKHISFYYNQNTGKYEATVSFSEFDLDGEWVLNSIYMRDMKDNSSYVYDISTNYDGQKLDFKPYNITFSGGTMDNLPPEMESITVTSKSQVTAGDSVKVQAKVTDDISGVSSVYAYINKPSGRQVSVPLHYNQTSGMYEGNFNIDTFDELGIWKLSNVYIRDKADNSKTIYDLTISTSNDIDKRDFSAYVFEVIETNPDLIGPLLDSLSISLEQVTNNGAIVKLKATVSDRLAGVSSISATYQKPSGQSYHVYFSRNQDEFIGTIYIDKYDQLGTWKLRSLYLYDSKQNSRQVWDSSINYGTQNEKDFSPFHFTVRGVITIPPPSPFSIILNQKEVTLEPGQSHQLQPFLHITDGTEQDITLGSSGTKYTSSNPSAVKVDSNGLLKVEESASPGVVYIQVENSGLYAQATVNIPGETNKESIKISPINMSLASGQTKQLAVEATMKDGTTKEVTLGSSGTKYSSDNSLVSVSSDGLVSVSDSASPGSAKISVEHNGQKGEVTVTITGQPTVKSLAIAPSVASIRQGETIQLSLRGTLTDGSSKDVTLGVSGTTYTTSDSSRAQVNVDGLITIPSAATNGDVTVTAKNNGISVQSKITVSGPELQELQVTPIQEGVFRGDVVQLSVKGVFSDGEVKDLSSASEGTTFTTSTPSRALVDGNGKVTIQDLATYGNVTITVKNGEFTVPVVFTVEQDLNNVLTEMSVSPTSKVLHRAETVSLVVTGTYGSGDQKDITLGSTGTTYVSSTPSRALVDANGKITIPETATYGEVTVTVRNGELSKSVVLTVEKDISNELLELSVKPSSQTAYRGETVTLEVIGTYGSGENKDLTLGSTGTSYVSSIPNRAIVDVNGKVSIPETATYGDVTITVRNGEFSKSVVLTVSNDLLELSIKPTSQAAYRGETVTLEVIGTYKSGEVKDLTLGSTGTIYVSSTPSRAIVDENGKVNIPELATYGNVTITVRNGELSKSVVLTVEKDISNELLELSVKPSSQGAYRGETVTLEVIGIYGSGEDKDLTLGSTGTTYVSSIPNRAIVDVNGKVSIPETATYGDVTITVRNGEFSKSVVLTVSNDLLELSIKPTSQAAYRGETVTLEVIGTYGSGDPKDLTLGSTGTTYVSSTPSRAIVDVNGKVSIPITATYGNVTITVRNGELSKSVVLTVEKDISNELLELSLKPSSQTAYRGETVTLEVIGTYGSGDPKDLTLGSTGTTYVSSTPSRAIVDENGKVSIPVTATYGNVTLTIKNGDISRTIVITIQEDPSMVFTTINASTPTLTLNRGATSQINVIGINKNIEEIDLTLGSAGTTYVSSTPSRAVISKDGQITVPTSATKGNVTITIRNGDLKTTLVLTIQ